MNLHDMMISFLLAFDMVIDEYFAFNFEINHNLLEGVIPDEGTALQSRAPVTNGANGMGAMDDPFSDPFSQVVCFKLLIAASRSVFGDC